MKLSQILAEKGAATITAGPTQTLDTVFSTLAAKRIGALVVVNGNGVVCGIISERDLVRAVAREGEAALSLTVADVMTENVVTCGADDTVHDVMAKMTEGRFRHMPVVEDGKLAGVVSIGDIVKNRIEQVEREAADMRAYIHAV